VCVCVCVCVCVRWWVGGCVDGWPVGDLWAEQSCYQILVFPAKISIFNYDCSTELNANNATRSEHSPVFVNGPLL
jgi:hypothetical protein